MALLVVAAGTVGLVIGILRRDDTVRVRTIPTPTAAERSACFTLAGLLPQTIGDGLKSRTVRPASPLLHAWGTPAAVLRCGVGYPPDFKADSMSGEIDGINWYATQAPDSVIYTTVDRVPRVSLAVPRKYTQAFDLLVSLTKALKAATEGS